MERSASVLEVAHSEEAWSVPVQAVERSGDSATVMVVNASGELEQRTVTTGLETAAAIEIVSGLREGEQCMR